MTETKQKVILVRMLAEKGYREKIITMIAGTSQSYTNKIIKGTLHKETFLEDGEDFTMTDAQKIKLDAVNRILSCPELNTNDFEQDTIYVHVLKFFLIDKDRIYELYSHLTRRMVSKMLAKKGIDIFEFDSTLIGIDRRTYVELIVDLFL